MTHFQKLRTPSILKWVSSFLVDSQNTWRCPSGSSFYTAKNPRFYGTKRVAEAGSKKGISRISRVTKKEAQSALLDYFYCTRNLLFTDAEYMSKNSPHFLEKLLQMVEIEGDVGQSISRFLRYHPINEFEPFFESLGLKRYEYEPILSRDLMFLSDDNVLLENYHALCDYGIARNDIGKMFKEAPEVFRYGSGILALKLQAYEQLGLSQSFVAKVVVSSPYLLIQEVNHDFIKVLEVLKEGGIQFSWIEECLSEKNSCNWSQLLALLNLFRQSGYSKEQLGDLISKHPGILFEGSGDRTLTLIGFLLKFGSTVNHIFSIFLEFPPMPVGEFISNVRCCFLFLNEIEMEVDFIGNIFCSHPLLLGSCRLKKSNTLITSLNVGKKRLCSLIRENPQELKKWVRGKKIEQIDVLGRATRSRNLKTNFLLSLGFVEDSKEMKTALKLFRGKAEELQERFDCLVKAGLDRKDVCQMVKIYPQILNQTKYVIEMKIGFLVHHLGYPVSTLVMFPTFLSYTIERVKLRWEMYSWLKNQGVIYPRSLSTVVICSDKLFIKKFVRHHPRGHDVWQNMQQSFYSK
uniref:Uncharacterized protein MANES_09G033100 n=1 Tax=Rhizophora mucronata TaxID=61149 RepID=A0A2P2IL33_RHIMU